MADHKLHPVTRSPYNAETPLPALRDDRTPAESFYVRNHFDVPTIDINQFLLHVNGATTNPLDLALDQIKAFPETSSLVILECAGNGRSRMKPAIKGTPWNLGAISQAEFTGTPLHYLLRETVSLRPSLKSASAAPIREKFIPVELNRIPAAYH